MAADVTVLRRPRRRDARDNDVRVLDAALSLAASEGWHGLLAPRVSAVAGLSAAPVRERFADRGALAAALWEQRIVEPLFARLDAVVAATPRPDEGQGYADPQPMLAAMEPFQQPDEVLLAASELLVMARFDAALAEAVERTWTPVADSWLRPGGGLTRAQAARHGFAISVALGLLLLARGVPTPAVRVDEPLGDLVRAVGVDRAPTTLPADRADHLDLGAVFSTEDPVWDALLQATLDEVGARGYDGATLDIIARSSGYSRGIMTNRYASKRDIVLDATRRMLAAAVILNEEYARRMEAAYGPGLTDACLLREFMDPGRRPVRSISLEQIRLAWHDEHFAAAMAAEVAAARQATGRSSDIAWHFALAGGQGAAVLADLYPAAAALPYDVVTVPLNALSGSDGDGLD